MIGFILKKILGSKNERDVKRMWPIVEQINEIEKSYQALSDDQLKAKTQEFKQRLEGENPETLDDLLPEAYAAVKNTCRRLCGKTWEVCGRVISWDMIPFDVQLIGGIVLHQKKIAEMATGEGKTLVATMPMYLNALTGKNVNLVTVNDYLAMRDCQWMGEIYKFLGLTVGCIQNSMSSAQRKNEYACDITYGTNSEFGFDYLRDNGLATSKEEQVQRDHFYAIIDEVDSILVDEARTPLIISGPASVSTHRYDKLKPIVAELVHKQTLLSNRLLKEAKDQIDKEGVTDENLDIVGTKLFQAQRGMPKNKQLAKMMEEPEIRKLVDRMEMSILSDLRKEDNQSLKEELYFIIEEKNNSVELTEKGRDALSPGHPDEFILPDMITGFQLIDAEESLSTEEKEARKVTLQKESDEKAERIHNVAQLLKGYCLFERDKEYVVQDNRVMIVDEFTGRLMPGRRYSDGLHQALEAKEGVQIERETQTFATITIQNYFRMYEKLAGMTGTAETEANEFHQIYKLDVVVIPTNRPVRRKDGNDVIYKTKREKYNAIVAEIQGCYQRKQPVLVGTVSVEVSEVISRLLKRQGIPHAVLNAKYHQKEAEIVAQAGLASAITIATNMAGRGTDIKLGAGVIRFADCGVKCGPECNKCPDGRNFAKECQKEPRCGLHVIGTERHEARRIDRQLRGRCARQGDPGSSRFYVSLEDDLMRLFGSDRIAAVMHRVGLEEGQELVHPLLTRSIERAQKRVEERNFSIRKHTLEYDDVMNKQREVIYAYRTQVLENENLKELISEMLQEVLEGKLEQWIPKGSHPEKWDTEALYRWYLSMFPNAPKIPNIEQISTREEWSETLLSNLEALYEAKEKNEGSETVRMIEQFVLLTTIDKHWKEHLYDMDGLREGIYLRAYGQMDPLVAYKQEGFEMFSEMMARIKEEIVTTFFRMSVAIPPAIEPSLPRGKEHYVHEAISGFEAAAAAALAGPSTATAQLGEEEKPQTPIRREAPKVGRNDSCPCGSGKKFKKCCGV